MHPVLEENFRISVQVGKKMFAITIYAISYKFFKKFTCLTLFVVFILYFLVSTQVQLNNLCEQAHTQSL